MLNLMDIQTRLKARGFDPGPLDGIPGRRTTAAVTAFQVAAKLPIKYPGTIGPKTIAALFPEQTPATVAVAVLPWLDLLIRKKGLHEQRDYAELSRWLKSDGKTLGDPRTQPWCGDAIETTIALSLPREPLPANPYLARNWLKFGIHTVPRLGAVGVFWRGKKNGTQGHVALIVGISADGKWLYVLGGNQSNGISVMKIAANRLLGARWPSTVELPAKVHLPVMKGGTISLNEA